MTKISIICILALSSFFLGLASADGEVCGTGCEKVSGNARNYCRGRKSHIFRATPRHCGACMRKRARAADADGLEGLQKLDGNCGKDLICCPKRSYLNLLVMKARKRKEAKLGKEKEEATMSNSIGAEQFVKFAYLVKQRCQSDNQQVACLYGVNKQGKMKGKLLVPGHRQKWAP